MTGRSENQECFPACPACRRCGPGHAPTSSAPSRRRRQAAEPGSVMSCHRRHLWSACRSTAVRRRAAAAHGRSPASRLSVHASHGHRDRERKSPSAVPPAGNQAPSRRRRHSPRHAVRRRTDVRHPACARSGRAGSCVDPDRVSRGTLRALFRMVPHRAPRKIPTCF